MLLPCLRAPHFVAHQDHRHAERKHRDGQEVLHLPVAQLLDCGIVGRAFDAAIPASVVVGAVAVVFAVGFVVLLVIGDEIVEREPVVTGHEVDALLGFAFLVTIDLGAAEQVGRQSAPPNARRRGRKLRTSSRNRPFHSFQLSPTKLPTWYRPAASQASAISFVPASAGSDSMSQSTGGFGIDMARRIARKDRGEVEPEAIHVHFLDPIAKAVDDHAADDRDDWR